MKGVRPESPGSNFASSFSFTSAERLLGARSSAITAAPQPRTYYTLTDSLSYTHSLAHSPCNTKSRARLTSHLTSHSLPFTPNTMNRIKQPRKKRRTSTRECSCIVTGPTARRAVSLSAGTAQRPAASGITHICLMCRTRHHIGLSVPQL